jgi:hypothetical protein
VGKDEKVACNSSANNGICMPVNLSVGTDMYISSNSGVDNGAPLVSNVGDIRRLCDQ